MAQTSNTTTQGALLKELYTLPPVRVLNDKSFLHDRLQKEQATMDFSGEHVRFPVTVSRSLGRGSRADGGVLPVAISEVDVEATATMAFHYYALEWTEALEEVSKSKEGAFESAVARKMKNVAIDMAKDLNRQWYNAGAAGVVATSTATATSATQTVASVQYVHVGDVLDQYPAASDTATSTGKVVSSISEANSTITFSTSVTGTSGDRYVISGSLNNEVEGLRAITNDARTLHGIDSSTYSNWDGEVVDAASAVAGESLFEQLSDGIGENGRGEMNIYLTTRGIRRRLADEFASQRRYMNEATQNIKAGYRSLEVNGHECIIDDDCPKGYVFGISDEVLKLMQLTKPGFMESEAGDGAKVELKDHTTAGQKVAAWQSWYRYHVSLVCTDPARTGRIESAEDDAAKQAR
jgi:hypothetical protein